MSVAEYEVYKRIKLLGEGSFGKAYLVECLKDGSLCVIKQVDLNNLPENEKANTLKEAKILEALKHPNIIKFREVYKTRKGKLCIVMDYADGGDLNKKIQEAKNSFIPESQILDWFTQICLALKHVHDRKILHRDLKCQNIFLTKSGIIKLGDFGIARVLSNSIEKAKTMVGTPYYLSPEIIDGKPYSFKSDIWSLGIILYELCALRPPFDGANISQLALKIVRGIYSPMPSQYSKELRNLVSMMLALDSNKRPSINQILTNSVITSRIKSVLSDSVRLQEFSHTILHSLKIDTRVKLEEIKNVINEAPIPSELLKKQLQQEKIGKEKQERYEKERQEKLERERIEREKFEREREKERLIHFKNVINLPSHRDISPINRNHSNLTPNLNNNLGIIISNNVTPKISQKIEYANPNPPLNKNPSNIIQSIITSDNYNNRRDYSPLSPARPQNNFFNPLIKQDPPKFGGEAKPFMFGPAPTTSQQQQQQQQQILPSAKPNPNQADQFIKKDLPQFFGLKSPIGIDKNIGLFRNQLNSQDDKKGQVSEQQDLVISKIPLKYPESEKDKHEIKLDNKFARAPETNRPESQRIKPSVSPRNMDFIQQPNERPIIKRYLTPMNNQRDREVQRNAIGLEKNQDLNKVIESARNEKLDRLKIDIEKSKLDENNDRKEKELQREEERKQMRLSIDLKRKSFKKNDNQIEIEWFIPPPVPNKEKNHDDSVKEANDIDKGINMDKGISMDKISSNVDKANNLDKVNSNTDKEVKKKPKENLNQMNEINQNDANDEESLIEILSEMKKIVEPNENPSQDEFMAGPDYDNINTASIEDREDDNDDLKDPKINTQENNSSGSNMKSNPSLTLEDSTNSTVITTHLGIKPFLEEELGIEKYKEASNCITNLMNKYLNDINLPIKQDPYQEFKDQLENILKKDMVNQYLPFFLLHAMNFDENQL